MYFKYDYYCFWVSGNVRLEQISFLSVSNFLRQSKLTKFSFKITFFEQIFNRNFIQTFPSFLRENHESKPNLIRFNDHINEEGKLGENIFQCLADLQI